MSMWQIVSKSKKLKNRYGPGANWPTFHYWPHHDRQPWKPPERKGILKYTHWPNPFGELREINAMICGPEVVLDLKFWGRMAGAFYVSNFVPSPVELTRRWLTGQYRCGVGFDLFPFKEVPFPGKAWGPLDILWTDGRASRALAGSFSPIMQGLFYLWAAGTAYNALQQWSTVMLEMASCDANEFDANMATGDADFTGTGGTGAPNGYSIISDPAGMANALDGFYNVLEAHANSVAFGEIISLGKAIDNVRIEWLGFTWSDEVYNSGPIEPFGRVSWILTGSKVLATHGTVQVKCTVTQSNLPISATVVTCTRFSVSRSAPPGPNVPPILNPDSRCFGPNMPYLEVTGV